VRSSLALGRFDDKKVNKAEITLCFFHYINCMFHIYEFYNTST